MASSIVIIEDQETYTDSEDTFTNMDGDKDCGNVKGTTDSVCQFYLQGKCRFGDECFNAHIGDVITVQTVCKSTNNKSKQHNSEEQIRPKKKPPLRTAGDVRKRIQWDSDLPGEYFTVGYLDRFLGVIEKPFESFSWEHIATVDLDELAIPQHRIQFYKYRGTKVWDKNERLDHVFGSANNNVEIHEIMKEVDEQLAQKCYDSDDSDDDIVVSCDKYATKELINRCLEDVQQNERATHFICIRVNNENLAESVKKVQDHIIIEEPVLRSCAMPSELLHVTLCMVKCETPESIVRVTRFLQGLQGTLRELFESSVEGCASQQRIIKAQGLSTFGARVLYSKLDVPSNFYAVVKLVQDAINTMDDVIITNHFDFVPHMTLLKVNRIIARERRSKYINSCLYNEYLNQNFGAILFNNLHFCSIEDGRGLDGFYITIRRIEF